MKSILLATKLHLPTPPSKWVERLQLIQRLDEGRMSGHRLTLVSAPAGFGKSVCISEWVSRLDIPVSWLTLDSADNDPGRFFLYFLAALQRVDESLGLELEGALQSGELPPREILVATLVNDIHRLDQPFILVLDDFHIIQDTVVLKFMETLIANQPQQLHLVLVTREDPLLPLARLRANNQMTEIRASDLRFSESEADQFLNERLGLGLSQEDIYTLENRTEGWIVGLQLAGLSVRDRLDPSTFIAGLSGSHRYILSYLTEEVLNRQPGDIQEFLLQTSLLGKLNGDLCDAVTGRLDSSLLLERLYNANLFLIPLDDDQQWYRYHHLFADLLRSQQNRTSKEQLTLLHRRASVWFAQVGMASEAIEHALAAADFAQAVDLVEKHALNMVLQGYAKTVEGWMQAIPTEWHAKSPRASLAFASMHLWRGNYPRVAQYIAETEASFLTADPPGGKTSGQSGLAEWLALKANLLNVQGKPAEGIATANQALKAARPDDFYSLSLAYMGLGGAYRLLDDYGQLTDCYQKALQNSRLAGNALAEMIAASAMTLMAIQHGQLRFAYQVSSQVIERFKQSDTTPPPVSGSVHGTLGMIYYEWNELEMAQRLYALGAQLSVLGGHNAGVVYARLLQARLYQAEGNLQAAAKATQEAVDLAPVGIPAWLKPEIPIQQVRISLAQGNPDAAEVFLKPYGIGPETQVSRSNDLYILAYLKLKLYRASEKAGLAELPPAIELAGRVVDMAGQAGRSGIVLQALVLRSLMHIALGGRAAALDDLNRALELAGPEGYARTFLDEGEPMARLLEQALMQTPYKDYANRLLAAFSQPPADSSLLRETTSSAPTDLVEPLTERELDVLRLIAEGLKYEEIAERLVISLNTVRFYVKEIYGKLQVNNRTRAIESARRLKLL